MAGVDRQRREHREDALLEGLDQELLVVLVELVPRREADARPRPARARPRRGRPRPCGAAAARAARGSRAAAGPGCGRRGSAATSPAATWSLRPATRTWKNSSRFWLKIARNLARSSSGTRSSSASASTRSLKSSHDSSRLRYRGRLGGGSSRRARLSAGVTDPGYDGPTTAGHRRTLSDAWRRPVTHRSSASFVLGVPQVPLEQDVLALGVAHDALAVAAELRVVRGQQHRAGPRPGPGSRRSPGGHRTSDRTSQWGATGPR